MGLQLRSPSDQIEQRQLTHTAAATAKVPIVINSRAVIPLNDSEENALNTYVHKSEISDAPAATGQAWAAGAALYWDADPGVFTTVATDNVLCGFALDPKASAAAVSGLIKFDSFAAIS